MSENSKRGPQGKVKRLLEEYGFEEFGDYLVDRWTAEDSDSRLSLRALAHEFNIRLIEERLAAVNAAAIDGSGEHYYRSLTDDAMTSGMRTQVRRNLEQSGIDVDGLKEEFVSRQAIHTYLTKTRDVSQPSPESPISTSSVLETIDRLQERVRRVTASRLERLRSAGFVTLGDFRVVVNIQVYCADCGTQNNLPDLLREETCDCK